MDMYQKMYYHLFNAITDALEKNNIEEIKASLTNSYIERITN